MSNEAYFINFPNDGSPARAGRTWKEVNPVEGDRVITAYADGGAIEGYCGKPMTDKDWGEHMCSHLLVEGCEPPTAKAILAELEDLNDEGRAAFISAWADWTAETCTELMEG